MTSSQDSNSSDRRQAARQIVSQWFASEAQGLAPSSDDLLVEHSELRPEIDEELSRLKRIQDAKRAARETPPPSNADTSAYSEPNGGPTLSVASSVDSLSPSDFPLLRGKRVGPFELESGIVIGDFRIERRLGAGGMGIVYLARQLSLNRLVALKVLGPSLTRTSDQIRFQREAQAAAKLTHASIARIYFVGQDEEVCYLAMEYIDGVSLRQIIDALRNRNDGEFNLESIVADAKLSTAPVLRFDQSTDASSSESNDSDSPNRSEAMTIATSPKHVRWACEAIRDVAIALEYAHSQGVIHRDIKPENILIDRGGGVHIIDFGIARFFEDQTLTQTGQLVGTPMYMSPEQVTGRVSVDSRTDIYSLGLVLYEILALSPPIEGPTREGVLCRIVTKQILPLSWRNPNVSATLEAVVHKACARDPDERFHTAAEFGVDIEACLTGTAVRASPYRFSLDTREIVVTRPRALTVLGHISAFNMIIAFMVGLGMLTTQLDVWAYPDRPFGYLDKNLLIAAYCILASFAFFVLSRAFLSGQRWAGLILLVGTLVGTFVGAFLFFRNLLAVIQAWFDHAYSGTMLLALLVTQAPALAIILAGVCFCIYLRRQPVKAWFDSAARIRSEHRTLKFGRKPF